MDDNHTVFANPRQRNLIILAVVAAASITLGYCGLRQQANEVAPHYIEREFFPGLAAHVRQAARIHIVSRKYGPVDVVFKPNTGWVVVQKHEYPASFVEVNKLLVGLAALEAIEPKTSRADWLRYLSLGAPAEGGDGIETTVTDDQGHVLAALITGKSEDIGDSGGASGLFVRRPGEDQAWLARAEFTPQGDPADWVDKDVIDIDPSRIQEVVVDPGNGPAYTVQRNRPEEADFKLMTIPSGREVGAAAAADGVAAAITGFSFEDVRPSRTLNFNGAARLVTTTFDGLRVTVDVARLQGQYWVQIGATGVLANRGTATRARQIDTRVSGWAYRIPDYKGAQFTTPLESLLKPRPAKVDKSGGPG